MPELKARAHTLNELADGARFLFARRPLDVDEGASALLSDDARKSSVRRMPGSVLLRNGNRRS